MPNGRWETTTMIAAMGRNGAQAPWVLNGPMDGAAFATWAELVLAPTLQPGDIIVMDNLSVHKNATARKAIEDAGAIIWDLPPYSPDLNPHREDVEQNKSTPTQSKSPRPREPLSGHRKCARQCFPK